MQTITTYQLLDDGKLEKFANIAAKCISNHFPFSATHWQFDSCQEGDLEVARDSSAHAERIRALARVVPVLFTAPVKTLLAQLEISM